jgi:UDP-glucose 4-epimerase
MDMSKTVLVTGGAGFIGSHVVEAYVKKGYKVVIIDNLSSGKIENIKALINAKAVSFYNIDIREAKELQGVFEKHKPDIINHHAAQKSVPYSVEEPVVDIEINGIGLLNLLMLTKKYPIESFIYVSSGGALSKKIQGDEKSKETDEPQLVSPYAITKFAGENYIKLYSELNNFNYTILRYANVYGPRQIADGECGVIPIFVNNILGKKPSMLMTYEDMPRGCTRDYINVEDVAQINILVSEKCLNETYNIGSGKELGILDIYEAMLKVFKSDLPIEIKGQRQGDLKRSVLDGTKVKETLNWQPKIELEQGLQILHKSVS